MQTIDFENRARGSQKSPHAQNLHLPQLANEKSYQEPLAMSLRGKEKIAETSSNFYRNN